MKGISLTLLLTLWGSVSVSAAPVEQHTTEDVNTVFESLFSKYIPSYHASNTTSRPHRASTKVQKSDKHSIKTKTQTATVTEDCSSSGEKVFTTVVEMSPTTKVLEIVPTSSAEVTVTATTVVYYDVTSSSKSLHKPKKTKHHWSETESSVPSSSKHSKHHSKTHSSKHHKSKSHSSKSRSSETIESPVPSSSQSEVSSESSVVVITTSEMVEVITTGYEEVTSTMTLTSGDSRFPTSAKTSSDSIPGITPAVEVMPPIITSAPTTEDITAAINRRDDPDEDYTKFLKPDKAMSKRMSRWSKHHNKVMAKQSSYRQKYLSSSRSRMAKKSRHDHDEKRAVTVAPAPMITSRAESTEVITVQTTSNPDDYTTYYTWWRTGKGNELPYVTGATVTRKIKSKTGCKCKHDDNEDDLDHYAVATGLPLRDSPMTSVKEAIEVVTVVTTMTPGLNETYSTSWRTRHASSPSTNPFISAIPTTKHGTDDYELAATTELLARDSPPTSATEGPSVVTVHTTVTPIETDTYSTSWRTRAATDTASVKATTTEKSSKATAKPSKTAAKSSKDGDKPSKVTGKSSKTSKATSTASKTGTGDNPSKVTEKGPKTSKTPKAKSSASRSSTDGMAALETRFEQS